jgi:hypothetical protein
MISVWTCIYCEGAWLPASQSSKVLYSDPESKADDAVHCFDKVPEEEDRSLFCPECGNGCFNARRTEGRTLARCRTCQSIFLNRLAVAALTSSLGGRSWNLGEAVARSLAGSTAIKVDGVITVGALLYLLLS